jgi:tellurite resistance protein TehA-like permease
MTDPIGTTMRQAPAAAASSALATFFPGYFSLVMATGIVSIAAHFTGLDAIAQAMLWFNVIAYVALWGITLARLVAYPRNVLYDLTHHARGVTFLTQVAGTCVLGSQFALLTPYIAVAHLLWFAGLVLWAVLIYVFFTAVTLREPKPTLAQGITGAWLLVTVSTESLAVLGTLVAPTLGRTEIVLFVSLLAYCLGLMLYIVFIALILYRWMFFPITEETLTPSYWINMGALAIATLAGSRLLLAAERWVLLRDLAPFLKGFTIFFWATAAWWIPLLVIAGVWRHGFERVPLTYDPQYWSLVFPLGMFTAATFIFSRALDLGFLAFIPHVTIYVALGAWAVTFVGMARSVTRQLVRAGR